MHESAQKGGRGGGFTFNERTSFAVERYRDNALMKKQVASSYL